MIALVGSQVVKWFSMRTILFTTLILLGVCGTSIAGHLLGDFYFSWPIVLFVVFEITVLSVRASSMPTNSRPWSARLVLFVFLMVCFSYFWLCRRLSLTFEWTFLMGFPFALPFLWISKADVEKKEYYNLKQWVCEISAFTVFYWVGAGIMLWKYPGS